MLKIIEIKETIFDSKLIENINEVDKMLKNIIRRMEFTNELNKDDYNYINIVMEKTKLNLEKVYELIK